MKILKLEHDRCNEFDCVKYYIAPNLSDEELEALIEQAQIAYLKAYDDFKKAEPGPVFVSRNIADYPSDMTISEIKLKVQEYELSRAEYEKLKKTETRTFDDYLHKFNIFPLWKYEGKEMFVTSVYWGHRHGDSLEY